MLAKVAVSPPHRRRSPRAAEQQLLTGGASPPAWSKALAVAWAKACVSCSLAKALSGTTMALWETIQHWG